MSWFKKPRDPFKEFMESDGVKPSPTVTMEREPKVHYDKHKQAYASADGIIRTHLWSDELRSAYGLGIVRMRTEDLSDEEDKG